MSYRNSKVGGLKRDVTRKMSGLLSPGIPTSKNAKIVSSASKTSEDWSKKFGLISKSTMKTNKRKSSKKLTHRGSHLLKSGEYFLQGKLTNAEALRRDKVKENNFLRTSINAAGQEQVHSRRSSSSRGFDGLRKKLKRGNTKKGKSVSGTRNDFAFQANQMRTEMQTTARKKFLSKGKISKSPALIKLDGESPYMEYLPDRYREYKPKEKKLKRQPSNVSLNSFFRKVDKAYSDAHSIGPRSRSGSREFARKLTRKGSNNKSFGRINSIRSQSSVSSKGGKSVRSNPSRLKKRKQRKEEGNLKDSFQKMAQLIKQRVLKNKDDS